MNFFVDALQASSDLATVDFDVPFATLFVAHTTTELMTGIGIMASVTWQVLVVAILATVAAKYIKVGPFSKFLLFFCIGSSRHD